MENLLEFFSFADPNIRYVTLGSVLLCSSAAIVGCFIFLKKKALVGDAVAHSVLPGVCLAFIIAENKNPVLLVAGAFLTGWISLVAIDYITAKSKIKEDTAIGLILSVFFGIGILMLTWIQGSGIAAQSGLDHFLFGKAASLIGQDLIVFGTVSIILLAVVFLLFKELTLISFDGAFAQSIGFPVRGLELILTTLTVLAVVTGIQAIGVVLMAAILVTPAAAAKFWTDKLKVMIILAACFGAVSGVTGAYISYIAPSMPTGPWIVMIISIIALVSFFFAPKKGIVNRLIEKRRIQNQITEENILKLLFNIGEADEDYFKARTIKDIIQRRPFHVSVLKSGLSRLKNQGFLEKENGYWKFTEAGKTKGQRMVKLHRLWELYLTEYLKIAPDHVHEDAETIEHIITPELEKRLEEKLQYPKLDPHKSEIPYNN
ncbi:iron chelate uptake ABC transporter family permease subunit [Fulvivirgaceae bacterium BMA10]|uniref:Iron chelate uptake ABC transporter family permease subunit n=1 Tax=Splendidivirga corallicola TaxID=3051826 RepID=A0ABT8KWV0_9BACT|nr:iron chelate uptake ABC transporter family permease subunit [Fulvivirgaceae bacterium BMA10]